MVASCCTNDVEMRFFRAVALVSVLAGCAPKADDSVIYTLYRSSAAAEMRIHVATFDAMEAEAYNRENCQVAAVLFQAQPGVVVHYWCEKGRYRK